MTVHLPIVKGAEPLSPGATAAFDAAMRDATALRSRWSALEAQGRSPGAQAAEVCSRIQSAVAAVWRLDAGVEGGSDD